MIRSPITVFENTGPVDHERSGVFNFEQDGLPYLLAAFLALTALWVSLGRFQDSQNADTLIQVLISVQRWTPFFWGSDRYGMLVPLLTVPIRNPLTNMMVQTALTTFACLAASFLLIRYFFGNSRIWFVAGALQNIWLVLLTQKLARFDWFVAQPYGPTFALGFAALLLLQKGRWLAGVFLMVLTHWVNFGAFVFLLPLVLLRHLIRKEKRGLALELIAIGVGVVAGFVAKSLSDAPRTPNKLLSVLEWMTGWQQLLPALRISVITNRYAVLWIVIPATLGLILILLKKVDKFVLLVGASFAVTGVAIWLFVGTQSWVRANSYSPRYMFSSLFLFSVMSAVLVVGPFQGVSPRRANQAALTAVVALSITVATVYGTPSREMVQKNLDNKFGTYTQEIIDNHVTLVAGDYWTVWPTVFDANLALYRLHASRSVYGLGYRSEGTAALWVQQRSLCASTPVHDSAAVAQLLDSPWHFSHVRTLVTIDVFCEPPTQQ